MTAIIFGINGQDGFYLNNLLKGYDIQVIGVSRSNDNWLIGNVADGAFVDNLIRQYKPDYIFHLAANSTTRHDVVFENHDTISTGTLNILESVYKHSSKTRVFLSGSGLQFVNRGLPISENNEFDASSPYCVSRIQSVFAARYYRTLGLKVYFGYFFNHDSPKRSERHVNQKIVSAVLRIASGSDEILTLGNVLVKKEFTFAADVVNAIWIFINNDTVFETVIGSGKSYSIERWLDLCFGYFNLSWPNYVMLNEEFKPDYDILVSNPSTLLTLGWQQRTSIEELAKIMIENG